MPLAVASMWQACQALVWLTELEPWGLSAPGLGSPPGRAAVLAPHHACPPYPVSPVRTGAPTPSGAARHLTQQPAALLPWLPGRAGREGAGREAERGPHPPKVALCSQKAGGGEG